jgi:DNA-binding transcriptional regulator YhcF (GntR family)
VIIAVDADSPVPPYEQVRVQLAALIEAGDLATEMRLPTVRQLAGDLGLAVNTVARSYRELEGEGFIETRGRHGSFVAPRESEERTEAVRATRDFTAVLRRLGIGPHEALALLRRELADDLSREDTGGAVMGARL